ncbi:hypothetical protein PZ61_0236270 [Streptomyces sp. MNU77]|uniref:hypothetical protein n=1 Tax=Streptomyces sp. MNU77 TaxID=1573406 RepID=UPI0005E19EFE|nr:hypothetical protein [Streptomyces sp. MNU77]OLO25875.1 hypothetical protein PZ61_0236270 [Streptomyces sp. MNU77]
MPDTRISSRARTYALYTGAPRQVACDVVAGLPRHAPLIPAPVHQAQLLLESEAFYRILSYQRDFFEFPFGIRYVQPTAEGIRLDLESNASLDGLLAALLPGRVQAGTGHDEIQGLNGVRITARTDRGIELRRLGQPTSIRLTGVSRRAFQKAETTLAERTHDIGGEASWLTGDTWTVDERRWEDERQPLTYESTWREAAWLPSGLLRRLGLLHTVAVPHVVTGHESRLGEWWILELDHASDTGLRRAELVQALTDPEHGLPLELRGHRDLIPGESLGLVLLKSPDGSAALQLRYDRFDYPVKEERAEMFAAIRRRISALTGEALLPPMPGCSATG